MANTWASILSWNYSEMVTADKLNQQLRTNMTALLGYLYKGDIMVAKSHYELERKGVGNADGMVLTVDGAAADGTGINWSKNALPYCVWKHEAYPCPGQVWTYPDAYQTYTYKGPTMNVGGAPFEFIIGESDAFYIITFSWRGGFGALAGQCAVRYRDQLVFQGTILPTPSNTYWAMAGYMWAGDYVKMQVYNSFPFPVPIHLEMSIHKLLSLT